MGMVRTESRQALFAGLVAFCEATYDAEVVCVETFQPKDHKVFCKGVRVAITHFVKGKPRYSKT